MSNQTNELKNMMASFFQMNTASSSGTGSLLSNNVANPRGDLKAITTRSDISYDGPPIPPPFSPLPKAVKRELEGMIECSALADLGASINLMPFSVWKKLSLLELTSTRITLELADRSITRPKGVAKDVFLKVGKFHYLAYFVVIDYDADPQISDSSKSGNPTMSLDPILSTSFPSLTPFEGGDFILEEIKACLTNDSIPPGIDDADFDSEGDLLLLEKLLNNDPLSPLLRRNSNFEEINNKFFYC
ncbi:reverse transcriptase domain-containing protein [Tanacetum coccineum]